MCIDVEPWEVERYLKSGSGISYGVEVEGKLISLFAVIRPNDNENLGYYRGLSFDELTHVAHWELTHVLHEYRGNGLQKKMGNLCLRDLLVEWADVIDIFATIYPHNLPSLKSTFDHGFVVLTMDRKYGGRDRYILYRRAKDNDIFDPNPVAMADIVHYERHAELFGQGLVGTALVEKDGVEQLVFCRLRNVAEDR